MNDQDWNPASTPPSNNRDVLVVYRSGEDIYFGVGFHIIPDGWSIDTDDWDEVTHWMPLPQKPKYKI